MYFLRRLLVPVCLFLATEGAWTAGIPWSESLDHFRGVDERGHLYYSDRIGEVDLGGNLKFPLVVVFDSSLDTPSLLGAGWFFPLLESNITPWDATQFRVREPGSWDAMLHTSSTPNQINSNKWLGTVEGDVITLRTNGGDSMVFNKGRIQSVTTNGRTFSYLYAGNRITEIREGNESKVQVVWNAANTEVIGLKFNGSQITFERTDRPKVFLIGGRSEIRGKDRTLGAINPSQGGGRKYSYGTDAKMHLTLTTNNNVFTWDPASRLILSDKDWNYSIKPGTKPIDHAAITRTNAKGQREYWYNDTAAGVETTENMDGSKWVVTRYVNGPLAGEVQKREKYDKGVLVDTSVPKYNAEGKQTSVSKNGETIAIVRDEKGRIAARVNPAGEKVYEVKYDTQDRKILEVEAGSYKNVTTYTAKGRHEEKYDGEGKLKGVSEYDLAGHNIMWSYPDGKVGRRLLDANGHSIALFLDGKLQTRFLYDSQEKLIQQIDYKPDGTTVALVEDKTVANPEAKGTPAGLKWAKDLNAATRKKLTDEALALTKQLNESLN